MFHPRGGEIEQHVPGGIGEQVAIEEARAQLALADDPAHQPRIGERRTRCAHQTFRSISRSLCRKGRARTFKAEHTLVTARRFGTGRPFEPFEPPGNLADLFGQPQQHQSVLVRQFAHRQPRHARQCAAQRNHPFGAAGIDQQLRRRLVKAGKDIVQRRHGGRHDQLRPAICRAQIKPGQCGEDCAVDHWTVDQYHLAKRPGFAFQQHVQPAGLGNAEARRLRIVAQDPA